jgi:hypothetical protein
MSREMTAVVRLCAELACPECKKGLPVIDVEEQKIVHKSSGDRIACAAEGIRRTFPEAFA